MLERLSSLGRGGGQEKVLEDMVMDILRILSAPDLEVRKKTLNFALELLTSRTVGEGVVFLRKEVARTHNSVEHDETGKYRQLLVKALHQCSVKVGIIFTRGTVMHYFYSGFYSFLRLLLVLSLS